MNIVCVCPFSPLKVRKINDQLMLLDRAFLDPLAFPDKYAFRFGITTTFDSFFGVYCFPPPSTV